MNLYCPSCQKQHHFRRPQATRYELTWGDHAKDVGEILLGVFVLVSLFFGLPLLLFLAAQ